MQNEKKPRRILSNFAFEEGIEMLGIWSPSGISTLTKSTTGVATEHFKSSMRYLHQTEYQKYNQ